MGGGLFSAMRLTRAHRQGLRHLERNEFEEAEKFLREALEETPTDPAIAHALAQAAQGMGDLEGAENALRKAATNEPRNLEYACELGGVLLALKKPEEALEAYSRACRVDDRHLPALLGMAQSALEMGGAEKAAGLYRRVLEASPKSWDARQGLADALAAGAGPGEAEAAYKEALALKPGDAASHQALARIYESDGRISEALAAREEAVRCQPLSFEAQCALGEAALKAEQWQRAFSAFQRAVRLNPDAEAGNAGLAVAFQRLQEIEAAEAERLAAEEAAQAEEETEAPAAPHEEPQSQDEASAAFPGDTSDWTAPISPLDTPEEPDAQAEETFDAFVQETVSDEELPELILQEDEESAPGHGDGAPAAAATTPETSPPSEASAAGALPAANAQEANLQETFENAGPEEAADETADSANEEAPHAVDEPELYAGVEGEPLPEPVSEDALAAEEENGAEAETLPESATDTQSIPVEEDAQEQNEPEPEQSSSTDASDAENATEHPTHAPLMDAPPAQESDSLARVPDEKDTEPGLSEERGDANPSTPLDESETGPSEPMEAAAEEEDSGEEGAAPAEASEAEEPATPEPKAESPLEAVESNEPVVAADDAVQAGEKTGDALEDKAGGAPQPSFEADDAETSRVEALAEAGRERYAAGAYEEALARWEEALKLGPDETLYNNCAAAMLALGRVGDALAMCRRAIERDPEYAIAHATRYEALMAAGLKDEAQREIDRLRALDAGLAEEVASE